MQALWEHGELKPAEIRERYGEPIKDPALRSYLTILVEKGHVARRKEGKVYFYSAKTPRKRALRAMLGEIVDSFFAGSTKQLLLSLVETERLSEADLSELRAAAGSPATTPTKKSVYRRARKSARKSDRDSG
jgi:predicted transcriptional regulator